MKTTQKDIAPTDKTLLCNAIKKAVTQAVLQHKRAGNSIATWRDEKVVWIPAEEIEVGDKVL